MTISVPLKVVHSGTLKELAGQEGFEPPASGFGDRRSTSWSYWPAYRQTNIQTFYTKAGLLRLTLSLGGPCGACIGDRISSSPRVRCSSSCSWSLSNFVL